MNMKITEHSYNFFVRLCGSLLRSIMDEATFIERSGDLEEVYQYQKVSSGKLYALIWLLSQVIGTMLVALAHSFYWGIAMFKNYIKTAFRTMSRNSGHAVINVMGLAIGIAVFILISMYVHYESGWDQFNENYDRIYRLGTHEGNGTYICAGVGHEVATAIPQILKSVRFRLRTNYLFQIQKEGSDNRESFKVPQMFWVDSTLFDVFSIEMVYGDPQSALREPYSVVITEPISQRMFGTENPLGRVIRVNDRYEVTVTGVVKVPDRFHIPFDALGSYCTLGETTSSRLTSWNTPTYVLLPENHDLNEVEANISTYFRDRLREANGAEYTFFLFPLKNIYLRDIRMGQFWKNGDLQFMRIAFIIAWAILLLATVNFINLTTAKGLTRAKEVGIRKVVGSDRKRMIIQFMTESVIYSVTAFVFALILIFAVMERFNLLMRVAIQPSDLFSFSTVVIFIAGTSTIGLAAGLYPAFYLSAFHPVSILKGEKNRGKRAVLLRRGLMLLQFSISIILIIGTLTVYNQVHYMKNKDLGFNEEHILQFRLTQGMRASQASFKNRLLTDSRVKSVAFSNAYPESIANFESIEYKGERTGFGMFTVDPDYFDVYDIRLKEGRFFDQTRETDRIGKFILNETAVKELGLEDPVVGTIIHNKVYESTAFPVEAIEIIGVVKDFHYKSLHYDIWPLAFNWNPGWEFKASVRIDPDDVSGAISHIRAVWQEMTPAIPFEFHFMDEFLDRKYKNDERIGRLIGVLAFLGLFIAALGLLGLSSFLSQQRTKEIGIRKVLGATFGRIFLLLTREFALLIVLACTVAFPSAWILLNRWLSNYPYRAGINISFFVASACIAIVAAILTVGWQVSRSANTDPVISLRYE